jgi:eukaryotic-like serine/threonine-protein kinase
VSPTRWRRVEQVYCEALLHDLPARPAFIAEACGDDQELRKEVESLLAEAGRCSGFLSSPGFESALRSIVQPATASLGPAPTPSRHRPAFFWFAIAVGVAWLGLYVCSGWVTYRHTGGWDFGWEYLYSREGWTAARIYADGPADGKLQSGDLILSFNRDPRAARVGPEPFRQYLAPGSNYSIRILRHGQPHAYNLRVGPWHDWSTFAWATSYMLLSLVNFATGLAMGLLKPKERLAQLGFMTQILAATRNLASPLNARPGIAPDMEFILNQVVSLTFPLVLAAGFHFFHRMSAESARVFVWRALSKLMYAVSGVLALSQLIYLAASLRGPETLVALAWRHFWIAELNLVFLKTSWEVSLAAGVGAICALIIWGYRHSKDVNYRRRIRWFAAGCTVGLAPEVILNLAGSLLSSVGHRAWLETAAWDNLRWLADGCMIAIPAALTYGVLKHRLLDISVVIRRGLRYLLARRILQAILILPFLGLALPIIANPNRSLIESLRQSSSIVNLVLLALIGLSSKYRRQMRMWLDRRFFREAYQQEVVLRRLLGRIKELDSVEEVSRLVCDELDSALHPKWLYLCQWKADAPDFTVVRASAPGTVRISAAAREGLLGLLKACKESRERPLPPGAGPLPNPAASDTALVIPVNTGKWNEGCVLLLGERKSEEPYTDSDRNLLDAVAGTVAVTFENLRLREKVDEDLRERREVLAHLDRDHINLLKECPACGACFDFHAEMCPADRAPLTLSLPMERTIAQRYRLERRIGKGGMGVVYEATDLNLTRTVAVKVMTGSLFGDQAALRRFDREARILAQLRHPNIVAIHDFGRLGGEGAYLVMERVAGTSWRAELQRLGKIPSATAATWFDQLLDGLHAAHETGVVHRDLKPENVIIEPREDGGCLLKILDFGLAKAQWQPSARETTLTETGIVMGTAAYMSPEQLSGEPADWRSDIFSVGVMAVEAITGSVPRRTADGTIVVAALSEQLDDDAGGRKTALHQILSQCLAADPSQRPSSAIRVRENLVSALRAPDKAASSTTA